MNLRLVDLNADLVAAWRNAFKAFPEVTIQEANLLAVAENTVVSPANSYGFMDGGIDQAYRDFFGPQIEAKVQDAISRRPEGLLPVGASFVVTTGHRRIPYMIVASTMVMPEAASEVDCYRAMRAVIRVSEQQPDVGSGPALVV